MDMREKDGLHTSSVHLNHGRKDLFMQATTRPPPMRSPGPVVLDAEYALPCPLSEAHAESIWDDYDEANKRMQCVQLAHLLKEVDTILHKHCHDLRGLLGQHLQQPRVQESTNGPEIDVFFEQTIYEHEDEHEIEHEFQDGFTDHGACASSMEGAVPLHTQSSLVLHGRRSAAGESNDKTIEAVKNESPTRRLAADDCIFETARERALAQQSSLSRFTRSVKYEWASGTLIIVNALFMGLQTEIMAQKAREDAQLGLKLPPAEPLSLMICAALFTAFFTFDLVIRWIGEGLFGFFQGGELGWCIFDIIIVGLSIVDSVFGFVTWSAEKADEDNPLGSISVLRVLRVARVVKLARVIRLMSFFRELRLMVYSILGCLKSLLWATLILSMTFYVFGITFVSGVVANLDKNEQWSNADTAGLREHFGSLGSSLLTLYMAMAGGRSWGEYYHFLSPIPLQYRFLFLAFLTFTIFAVLNIVTGVFVDSAMQANHECRQVIIHEELDAKKEFLKDLRDLFHEMDQNGDGTITSEEFNHRLGDEKVIAYFKALKLDITDTQTLFQLLDTDESSEVDIQEFLEGCYALQGEARSIDTKIMRLQLQYLVDSFEQLQMRLDTQDKKCDAKVKRKSPLEIISIAAVEGVNEQD